MRRVAIGATLAGGTEGSNPASSSGESGANLIFGDESVVEALPWRAELIRFVTEVVRRWEPRSFSDRIEAAVGADLQYIRMNGTVVGGLFGGALHLLAMSAQ